MLIPNYYLNLIFNFMLEKKIFTSMKSLSREADKEKERKKQSPTNPIHTLISSIKTKQNGPRQLENQF